MYTIELVRRLPVVTSAGRFDTNVVRTTRIIELQLAHSLVETVATYAPDVGVVQSTTHQNTVALGWLKIKKTQHLHLVATPLRHPRADKNIP